MKVPAVKKRETSKVNGRFSKRNEHNTFMHATSVTSVVPKQVAPQLGSWVNASVSDPACVYENTQQKPR